MNTLIYLWVEPVSINHKRCNEKVYFNLIINGDFTNLSMDEIDNNVIEGGNMVDIMDFADIDSNWNYAAVKATKTNKAVGISFANSPEKIEEIKEEKKVKKAVIKVINSKKDIPLTKESVVINNGGKLDISIPALKITDTIDFGKIWKNLQKQFIGKIKEGDIVTIFGDNGEELIRITGGSFLNIGVADLSVYSPDMPKNPSMWDKAEHLIGGLFVRDDGSIDIGDKDRTFYMKINTSKLLKTSLKLNKPLTELTSQKLLE